MDGFDFQIYTPERLVTASQYNATGKTINFTLNCVPLANGLTVLKNTGPAFIQGAFSNLTQGQAVALSFAGVTYLFVANYYGGNGNDLVLVWAGTRVVATGQNGNGQLGDNTTTQRLAPVTMNTSAGFLLAAKTAVAVATGGSHSLALCSDGTVAAWGLNSSGQLGDNTTTQRNVSVAVNAQAGSALFGKTVVAVAAGNGQSMAVCSDGTETAWGLNTNGQLGDNTTTQHNVPVAVNAQQGSALFGKTVLAVAASSNSYSLALCSDGTMAACGLNSNGQLGDSTTTQRTVPVLVNRSVLSTLEVFSGVSAGSSHSLALVSWPMAPQVTTQPASGLTTTGATLNVTVNANGNSLAMSFEYGTTNTYGTTVIGAPATVTGSSPTAVNGAIMGLLPGILYHYHVNGDNMNGADQTFSTLQSSNPNLAGLRISEGTLSPAFDGNTTQYTATATSQATNMSVTPTVADYGTVTVNGTPVTSGNASTQISLAFGANILTIVGTSQDNSTTKTYTVTVTRPPETQTLNAVGMHPRMSRRRRRSNTRPRAARST